MLEAAQAEVADEHQTHYDMNLRTHRPGITTQEVVDSYSRWAKGGTYECVSKGDKRCGWVWFGLLHEILSDGLISNGADGAIVI